MAYWRRHRAADLFTELTMADVQISVIEQENTQIVLAAPGQQGPGGAAGQGVPVGGATGEVLVKTSNTDYDTEWAAAPVGNITAVVAGTGLSGGGSSGSVTLTLNAGLGGLADVDTTTTAPSNGQALAWDGTASLWKPMNMLGETDLGYTTGASSGEVTSSTGDNATIPAFNATEAGLVPASGGTATNFLSADGTWTVPAGVANLGYTTGESSGTVTSSTGTDAVIPVFTNAIAGLVPKGDGSSSSFLTGAGTFVSAPSGSTDLGYTAASSEGTVTSSTGTDATLPAATQSIAGLLTSTDKTKLDGIATGAQVNVDTDLSYTASSRELASSTGDNVTLPFFDTQSTDAGLVPGSNNAASTTYLDATGNWSTPAGGSGAPGGSNAQIQFNDSGSFGGDSGLTYDKTTNALTIGVDNADPGTATVKGDLSLDSGSNLSTTIQSVTATANRTITFPDQTGTVGLVSGATGNIQYNNAGQLAGTADLNVELDWAVTTTAYTGLRVNVNDNGGNSNANTSIFDLQKNGTSLFRILDTIPQYADDAAAGTGGLTTGDVYVTSAGSLQIKL